MKRLMSLALALLLTLALAACGGGDAPSGTQKDDSSNTAAPVEPAQNEPADAAPSVEIPAPKAGSKLVFVYRDCPLPMNAEFAPLLDFIGESDSYFEAASCAFDGLDKTYTYSDVEIITYPDEDVEYISSIRLLSSAAATPEGITIGSSMEDVVAAYGEAQEVFGEQYTYEDGDTQMFILFENDAVVSLEYSAINPLLG